MTTRLGNAAANPRFCVFENDEKMFEALADDIAERLASAVALKGHASFVAAGGSTPGGLYDLLSRRRMNWSRVSVTLSDERWIGIDSATSNEMRVRTRLLAAEAATARFVPLKTGHAHARDALPDVQMALAGMPRPFDVVLLGMGTDGHIASLIPNSDGLAIALGQQNPALVRAVNPPDLEAMGERLTLTLRAILDAQAIYLLIKGQAKRAAYQKALAGSDILEAPVRAVLHQVNTPVSVCWSPAEMDR